MNIKRVFIVILAMVLIAVILIGFSRPWIFKMEYETSNPNDYKKCLNLVNHLDGVNDIFPKDVPSDAMDVDFDCYNNLGGKLLKLSYLLSSDDIKEFKDKVATMAICFGGKDTRQIKETLPESKLVELQNDDLLYVLCSEPYKDNDFNHARLVWVIMNESSGCISFNAEEY